MKSRKRLAKVGLLGVILLLLFAQSDGVLAKTVKITHELGTANVPVNPQRIVVFDYATLDSLDNMGVQIIGLPKSNIPEYLSKFNDKAYVDVGTLFEPNFEKIFELAPDVIFISSRQATQYKELSRIAPTLYLTIDTADYLGSFSNNLRILGQIFDKTEFVEQQIKDIEDGMKEIRDKAAQSGLNALLIMANDGALSAYGPSSRFGVVHNEFGFPPADQGIQVANHGQSISFEYLTKVNPDYLFVIDRAASVGGSISAQQVLDNDLVKSVNAYKNDRIIYLTSQVWYVASGGLTGTKIMIEDMAKAFE